MERMNGKVGQEHKEPLDAENYKWWLNAVETDDICQVDEALSAADDSERNILLNGSFHYYHKLPEALRANGALAAIDFQLTRPWCIAGAAGSHNVMNFMLSQNVDINQKDLKGYNVVHALIMTAYLEPCLEESLAATYVFLRGTLNVDQLKSLLEATNDEGFNAVEYAVHLGVYLIMQEIFNTEGVYLIKEEINSVYTIDWYRVTDYEKPGKNNRRIYSPIYMLMMLEDKRLTEDIPNDLFATPLVQNWAKIKMKTIFPALVIWFLVRAFFLASFLMTDIPVSTLRRILDDSLFPKYNGETSDETTPFYVGNISAVTNTTTETPTSLKTCDNLIVSAPFNQIVYLIFIFYILLHALFVIIFDILETITLLPNMKFFKTPKGYKNIVVSYYFYRTIQFFQAIMIVLYQTSKSLDYSYGIRFSETAVNFFFINITMSMVWSILFFVQLMPWIGHFAVAVVSMVMKLFQFGFFFCGFSVPFVGTFQRLINSGKMVGSCPAEFENFGVSFYTVFTVMLNMVDFRKFNTKDPTNVFLLHAIYIFMTAILLINFLIALFSTTFLRIDDHRQVVQTVQRLSVCWLIEERLRRYFPCLYRWCLNRAFPRINDTDYAVPCMVVCRNTKSKLGMGAVVRPQSSKRKRPMMSFMIK